MPKYLNDLLPALLAANTIILGLLTVYIAYQQWRTNHLKLRHDLYERRLAIYNALIEFLSGIQQDGNADTQKALDFMRKTRESYFLFDSEIAGYLETIYKKAINLHTTDNMLQRPGLVDDGRKKLADKSQEITIWLGDQYLIARKMFGKFLRLG